MCYGARSMKFTFQQEDKTMTAQEAYNDLMEEISKYDENPTYELCAITLVNRYGVEIVNDMEDLGLIKYVGQNFNNLAVYKIR